MHAAMGARSERNNVPGAVVRALFRHPQVLESALEEGGLAAHDLALWARQASVGHDVERLAAWLSVGHQPGDYRPLIDVAAYHLRAGELWEALPVFRWAYRAWQTAPSDEPGHRYDGCKALALWGECLSRLGQPDEARKRWLWALTLAPDAETLARLARTVERAGTAEEYEALLAEARRRHLPGAEALGQCPALSPRDEAEPTHAASTADAGLDPNPYPPISQFPDSQSVAVMADVANLDMVCSDQFGYGRRLDYGRLLQAAGQYGPIGPKIAFVPEMPETLPIRAHLAEAGFEIDLKRPKRSHGRLVANADTAMAAAAVRWASDARVQRLELWTGDGDFLKVREVVNQAWPQVTVAFRSFEVGTALAIQRLGANWLAIGPEYLQA